MNTYNTILTNLLKTNTNDIKLTIYQPTHQASSGQKIQEDTIRFKNALKAIKQSDDYNDAMLGKTMRSLETLLDDAEFWKRRRRGLAVFADMQGYQTVSLDEDIAETYYVGRHFFISPLVLLQSLSSRYYVLDINLTRPRLLEGSPSSCTEIVIDGMPESFEVMTANVEYSKELQHQSGGTSGFHGHTDDAAVQENTMRYYRKISEAASTHLSGHTEPLLLIGVENRVGEIRQLLSYPHILDEYIEGNGEAMNEQALHSATTPIIERYSKKQRSDAVALFNQTPPTHTLVGLEDIEVASIEGRVATVLIPCYRQTTDTVREGYDELVVLQLNGSPNNEELESLVRSVLSTGGAVQAVAIDAFGDEQPRGVCRF